MTPDFYRQAVWDAEAVRMLQERTRQRQIEALNRLVAQGKSLLNAKVQRKEHDGNRK